MEELVGKVWRFSGWEDENSDVCMDVCSLQISDQAKYTSCGLLMGMNNK
jgi:hypothetical protein